MNADARRIWVKPSLLASSVTITLPIRTGIMLNREDCPVLAEVLLLPPGCKGEDQVHVLPGFVWPSQPQCADINATLWQGRMASVKFESWPFALAFLSRLLHTIDPLDYLRTEPAAAPHLGGRVLP